MTRLFRRLRLFAALACVLPLAACDSEGGNPATAPPPPTLDVTALPHTLLFEWFDAQPSPNTNYLLQYSTDGGVYFAGGSTARATVATSAHLEDWSNTLVRLLACRGTACSHSNPVALAPLVDATYEVIHAHHPSNGGGYGTRVALSADGRTLAIAEPGNDARRASVAEDCDTTAPLNCLRNSGAVYIYGRNNIGWERQAVLKASNAGEGDLFGESVALSASGNAIVIGAQGEDSGLGGLRVTPAADNCNGNAPAAPCLANSGAAYLFKRNPDNSWTQRLFIKAEKPGQGDIFGDEVAISNGYGPLTVLIGAMYEDGAGHELESVPQTDCGAPAPANCRENAGAVYVFTESAEQTWRQSAYVKPMYTHRYDVPPPPDANLMNFGSQLALAGDGKRFVATTGNRSTGYAAAEVFNLATSGWTTGRPILFSGLTETGIAPALSNDGRRMALGLPFAEVHGSVYVMEDQVTHWEMSLIKAPVQHYNSGFGKYLAMNELGTRLAIGAPFHNGGGSTFESNLAPTCMADSSTCAVWSGAVHVFELNGDAWVSRRTLKPRNNELFYSDDPSTYPQAPSADRYGSAVALSADGTRLAVGSPYDDSGQAGIGGDASDGCELLPVSNCVPDSGTVFVY